MCYMSSKRTNERSFLYIQYKYAIEILELSWWWPNVCSVCVCIALCIKELIQHHRGIRSARLETR